jgi:predicted unusual protein kinase regulating ubiquinone biosynthesis (AarF/ABC1/UbiB family)
MNSPGPLPLRQFLLSCGAYFVKAGQVFTTRYDLVPLLSVGETHAFLRRCVTPWTQ